MKKMSLLMLVFALFASTSVYAQKLKNGTYEGSAMYGSGYVRVTISGRKIKEIYVYRRPESLVEKRDQWMKDLIDGSGIEIDKRGDYRYRGNLINHKQEQEYKARSFLLKKEGPRYTSAQDFADAIVTNQSTVIDVMGGATATCEVVIDAVHDALKGKNSEIVRAWEQEGKQKRLATAQRRARMLEEIIAKEKEERERLREREAEEKKKAEAAAEAERQIIAKAEAEKKRQMEEANRKAEEARQQRIAEALKQPTVTPAASEFKYGLADGTYGGVKIIKYLGSGMCIRIPEKIEGLPITEIATDAFDKNSLVKIVIPGTVRVMSFSKFTELREVTLGDGMIKIPVHGYPPDSIFFGEGTTDARGTEGAFDGCTNLNKITIPNSVTEIEEFSFRGCKNLKSITLPYKLPRIKESAFQNSGLTSIVIPDSVTEIGRYAFSGCKSLRSVTLPKNLKGGSQCMFSDCSSLSEIIIPEGVKGGFFYIKMFYGCSSLSLAMKSKLRQLGYNDEF